ncbi:MAG: NF038120 family PEP-CTERM protein, partial [Roseateles sp.]
MKLMKKALALAALAACGTASAGLLTFDDLAPNIFGSGESVSQTDVNATVLGAGGFGALLNGADPSSCDIAACPLGNSTIFFAGLNDSGLNLSAGGRFVSLKSLDFGFVAPVPVPGLANFGRLVVEGLGLDGASVFESREFGAADANGEFSFASWDLS